MSARRWASWLSVVAVLVGLGIWRWSGSSLPSDGREVPASPVRIASLTLGTDEILAELVSPDRVVCVTYLADDPEISNVTNFYPRSIPRLRDTDPERIIGLNPDLVCVAPYNSADFLKVMERSGLSVYHNEAYHHMDEIEAGILDLGKRVAELDRAHQLVERMRGRRLRLADQLHNLPNRPRVLYWSSGFTSGQGTTIDDVIRLAGGVNVAAEQDLKGPVEISPERVIQADPEIVLVSRWSAYDRESSIEKHPILLNLRAVREHRVIAIEGRYLTSVSQHVIEGAERLARQLHPERFRKDLSSSSSTAP
jgi:iron complex transport system substrate-binding protein